MTACADSTLMEHVHAIAIVCQSNGATTSEACWLSLKLWINVYAAMLVETPFPEVLPARALMYETYPIISETCGAIHVSPVI